MKKVFVTTSWDDGHVKDVRIASLLKKYNVLGTFYISPEDHEFSTEDRLTKEQIQNIAKDFEIGAHTMTHPILPDLTQENMEKEIVASKTFLEEVIEKPVTAFCYPSGEFGNREKEVVIKSGFLCARSVKRYQTTLGEDRFEIPTTIHAYNHWLDAWHILVTVHFNPFTFIQYYRRWDLVSKSLFDSVLKKGGVFHIWGHSWEVNKNGDWDKLEEVLRYISNRKDVQYVTNSHLVV